MSRAPLKPRFRLLVSYLSVLALTGLSQNRLQASPPADHEPRSLDTIRRELREIRPRLRSVADSVKTRLQAQSRLIDVATNLQIEVQGAEAVYQNEKLKAEIDEINVMEFKEGLGLQERAKLEGAVKLAQSDVERQQKLIDDFKAEIEHVRKIAQGANAEIVAINQFETDALNALINKFKFEVNLKQAQAQLETFNRLVFPNRVKDLEAAARIAKLKVEIPKAEWKRLENRWKTASDTATSRIPTDLKPVLPTLANALALDSAIDAIESKGKPDETSLNDLAQKIAELNVCMNEIELRLDDIAFAELERQITIEPAAGR